ncbi:MAG: Mur ligase domain-containing protein [Bacilli bacterium]|jgi:UDP-N-acetylmuramate--alanine ligase|nr:Mur ligase domain-containing protein [Bacilli bacterium]
MNYYLIGIKGSGMASLAHILKDLGNEVSGSDIDQHIFLEDDLRKRNIPIYSFNPDNLKEGMIVIKGNAFDDNHPEVLKAKELKLTIYTYMDMLTKLIDSHYTICIAGTHGKTTTTGLVSQVLMGKEATGYLIGDGHGQMLMKSKNFVLESCEYQDHYLAYYPNIVLINNVEYDHVDYFKTVEQYIASFKEFASHAKDAVVINGDDEHCLKIPKKDNFYYFGQNDNNNFQAKNIILNEKGMEFDLYSDFNRTNKELVYHFKLNLYGIHILYNVLATIAIYTIKRNEEDYSFVEEQLNHFKGVARRFNIIEQDSNVFIDDYAHHPTAIKLNIETARQKYPYKKIIAFFKPDRYSRIFEFGEDIAKALDEADDVYLFEFPETSKKEPGIDIDMNYVKQFSSKAKIINEDESSIHHFKDAKNTVFLMMSSKNVYDYSKNLMNYLRK